MYQAIPIAIILLVASTALSQIIVPKAVGDYSHSLRDDITGDLDNANDLANAVNSQTPEAPNGNLDTNSARSNARDFKIANGFAPASGRFAPDLGERSANRVDRRDGGLLQPAGRGGGYQVTGAPTSTPLPRAMQKRHLDGEPSDSSLL